MNLVLVETPFDDFFTSIERYCRHTGWGDVARLNLTCLVSRSSDQSTTSRFYSAAESLRQRLRHHSAGIGDRVVVILDFFDWEAQTRGVPSPLSVRAGRMSAAVAMLVLAFPEVEWVFPTAVLGGTEGQDAGKSGFWRLLKVLREPTAGCPALFDPTGLRALLRARMVGLDRSGESVYGGLPLRRRIAAAIDEESEYAYFAGYAAYRMGLRSAIVTKYGVMKSLFAEGRSTEPFELVIEDLYLRFPDLDLDDFSVLDPTRQKKDVHVSSLTQRDRRFPGLADCHARLLLTAGHHLGRAKKRWPQNLRYLRQLRKSGQLKAFKIAFKPLAGLVGLCLILKDLLRNAGIRSPTLALLGRGRGTRTVETTEGHSAPGRLLAIADELLARVRALKQDCGTVQQALYGATLALEAEEYLGDQTPTLSLEALSLRNEFEVMAECMFYGMEYNIETRQRCAEIAARVRQIGRYFSPARRRAQELGAEEAIVSRITGVFRANNQFDEEVSCVSRMRHVQRELWFRRRGLLSYVLYPLRWYVDTLLSSVWLFVLAVGLWVCGLGLGYRHLLPCADTGLSALTCAVVSFFGVQHAADSIGQITKNVGLCVLTMTSMLGGFLHLGVLVSHLYALLARR